MSRPARWLVFGLEVGLGLAYLAAFALFVTESRDFIVVRNNERAMAAARATQVDASAELPFGARHAPNALLGAGWWSRDESPAGVWSRARAYVFLPVPSGTAELLVDVDGEPFLAARQPEVEVALSADGTEVGRWTARYEQPPPEMVVTLPATVTSDGLVELRFDVRPVASLEESGFGDDDRKLGIFLRSISVRAAP